MGRHREGDETRNWYLGQILTSGPGPGRFPGPLRFASVKCRNHSSFIGLVGTLLEVRGHLSPYFKLHLSPHLTCARYSSGLSVGLFQLRLGLLCPLLIAIDYTSYLLIIISTRYQCCICILFLWYNLIFYHIF